MVYGQWFVWKLCAVYVLSVVILCEGGNCGCVWGMCDVCWICLWHMHGECVVSMWCV